MRGALDAEGGMGYLQLRAYYYDGSGAYLSYQTAVTRTDDTLTTTWEEGSGQVTTPANAASVRLYLYNFSSSGWAALDNVRLSRPSGATIQRSTYGLAGQMVATRVSGDPVGGNNGLFFFYGDHLGSSRLLVTSSNGVVAGSRTWYLPFGGYRGTSPTQAISDRDFTGQKENRELGLLYYNARFYVPGIGRFASADTIVPNPANPQSFNRYSYVRNSPLNMTDPTGHRECANDSNNCSPYVSPFLEALYRAWIYYEGSFVPPFEDARDINQGFGPGHDGVDYDGEFTVHAPAPGVVAANAFNDPPAGMWMIQNQTTNEIRTWSRWRTDPGWQGELTESDRGDDGLLEPERLLLTGEWEDIRDNWSHSPGTMIRVDHDYNLSTTYFHTVPALAVNQQVETGDVLGNTANNGWSSGSHLHYRLEFTYGGKTIYLNPLAPPRSIFHLLP